MKVETLMKQPYPTPTFDSLFHVILSSTLYSTPTPPSEASLKVSLKIGKDLRLWYSFSIRGIRFLVQLVDNSIWRLCCATKIKTDLIQKCKKTGQIHKTINIFVNYYWKLFNLRCPITYLSPHTYTNQTYMRQSQPKKLYGKRGENSFIHAKRPFLILYPEAN